MARKKLVILSGAGISAESGLKTFRDSDGLWEGYDVMEVATFSAWKRNPALLLDFYNMRRKNVTEAEPNAAHFGVAEFQKDFDTTVITQNIDDLHERGGSEHVIHLHGEIFKMRSENDESLIYDIRNDIHIGDLAKDGSQLRPHIVWFEEAVPMMEKAIEITAAADLFVVIGTSMAVYPAAGLLNYVKPSIPVFILDKKLPVNSTFWNFTVFEKPATEGIEILTQILKVYV